MEFLKYIPLVFQAIEQVNKAREAIRQGGNVFDTIKQQAPGLIDFFTSAGKQLFPHLDQQAAVTAGAQRFDIELVKSIQAQLNRLGASLDVDGSYGAKTKAAVQAFQTAHPPLVADGWAGKLTQAALAAEIAKLPA